MKPWAFTIPVAFVLAGCQDTTPPEQDSPTSVAPSFQVYAGVPDIIVNTTSDVVDFGGDQQVRDLRGPDGFVSLREAIIAANNTAGPQVIGFNIPDDGSDPGFDGTVFTIQPTSTLPKFGDQTTIDGATQTAFSGNTNTLGPEIVLDGSLVAGPHPIHGLQLGQSNNHVHALVIHSFFATNILVAETDNRVTGCFLGTDRTGSVAMPGTENGIEIDGSGHIIGGVYAGEGNVVSGHEQAGINIFRDASDILVQGNLIGTDVTGTYAIGNKVGVQIGSINLQRITIGGLTPGARNIISGNDVQGVQLGGANGAGDQSQGHRIVGNFIGTDITGTIAVPNGIGVQIITESVTNQLVDRNVIAFNGQGVLVEQGATDNTISQNSIFSNGGVGIDLANDGVTPNDAGDIDTGPNNLMNFPVLTSALTTPGQLVVRGTIDTPNPETVTIELFANPVSGGDPTGHGEGAEFLGTVTPNVLGLFTARLPAVTPETLISATATDANGNTSEFLANIEAESRRRGR